MSHEFPFAPLISVSWVPICTTFIYPVSSDLHHIYLSYEFPFAPYLSISWFAICTTFICLMSFHLHHIYLSHEFPFAPRLSVSWVPICTTFTCLMIFHLHHIYLSHAPTNLIVISLIFEGPLIMRAFVCVCLCLYVLDASTGICHIRKCVLFVNLLQWKQN
jgi:hypothetical protein